MGTIFPLYIDAGFVAFLHKSQFMKFKILSSCFLLLNALKILCHHLVA